MNYIELYLSGMSIKQVHKETGIPLSNIRNWLCREGILRTRQEGIVLAASQGRLSHGRGVKRIFTDKWKSNLSRATKDRWEGKSKGFSKKPSGYIEITTGEHKGRSQHVVIAEEKIGRKLLACECVHHKDERRDNNDPDNLEVMTRSEHARLHRLKAPVQRTKIGQFKRRGDKC